MALVDKVLQRVGEAFPGRSVFFDPSDVPADIEVPAAWNGFGLCHSGTPNYPKAWNQFVDEFPSVVEIHTECLLGTALLIGEELELLYVFHNASGLYYYLGGAPVEPSLCETDHFRNLPEKLQAFYTHLHDGYTFFPARSMGPRKLSDMIYVSELVDEEDVSFAEHWLTVFSSGGGDFVALDTKCPKGSEGLVWWHEDPEAPELEIDVFEVMDAWMAIFLEETVLRDEALVKLS
ncbi:SMI1/KNR4 family protein [Pseudomonas alabamensis]|uniref:SMI1/KNR4 family protein n=1 Tax=Pseudomonas alabamensis TaxID=3064349 RepID=UPI0021D95DB5|nr:SMI1/KNR4 family protein [Pseudomonas entomophila]